MYHEHFELSEDPFTLNSTQQARFQHGSYARAWTYLQYALHRGEGIVLLTGEPGLGKSTLVAELEQSLSDSRISVTSLSCNEVNPDELIQLVGRAYGLSFKTDNKMALLMGIETVLTDEKHVKMRSPVLVLDEAQTLPVEALEQVRLLTNLHWHDKPLLQVFLVGQPALRKCVLQPGMEQLHQRIVASATLEPLERDDVQGYVEHRLRICGWNNRPLLDEKIYGYIHTACEGIPRWVNLVMSRLLLHAMVETVDDVKLDVLRTVLKDLINEDLLPARSRARKYSRAGH